MQKHQIKSPPKDFFLFDLSSLIRKNGRMFNMLHAILFTLLSITIVNAKITRAPYIQLSTENSQVIVWRTNAAIKPVVRIGKALDKLDTVLPSNAIHQLIAGKKNQHGEQLYSGKHGANDDIIQFEAYISGLAPNTIYYYALYDGDQRLTPSAASYRFKTHPKIGTKQDTRFWVVGDSGTGGKDQISVYKGILKYLRNNKISGLDGFLHVGDMAYGSGHDKEFSDKFFNIYGPTLRNTTCWASMGNHEGHTSKGASQLGPYYDAYVLPTKAEAGGVPSGNESYYSFDFGNVHFICLNSHDLDRAPTAAMAQWLKADLEKTKADWLIAFWHHPPYTKGSHDSDKERQLIEMRTHIMPILETGGVDAVFTGHSHIYERSMLIDGAYHTPSHNKGVVLDDGDGHPKNDGAYKKSQGLAPNNGAIQVVAGNGGARLRRKANHVLMSKVIMLHGSVLLETKNNKLTIKMVDTNGDLRDLCQIIKAGKVKRSIVTNPRAPQFIGPQKMPLAAGKKMPKNHQPIIAKHSDWHYLAGTNLHPAKGWTGLNFDTSNWKTGKAGFGYSDKDDNTIIEMKDKFTTVYTRKTFQLNDLTEADKIGIAIKYDDAFIAYINGVEVARDGVDFGNGSTARGFHKNEARKRKFFPLKKHAKLFKKGNNVISIEGHNAGLSSSDFTLDAYLTLEG